MVQDESLRRDGAVLTDRGRGEGETDACRRAAAGAGRQPGLEVDERDTDELVAFVCRVARRVRVANVELDEFRRACLADERVDKKPAIVDREYVRGRGRVDGRGVVDRPVQGDRLELTEYRISANLRKFGDHAKHTKLYLKPTPSWKYACLIPSVAAWSV